MAVFCCESRRDCVGLAAAASVVLGIIAAFLTITAVVAVTPAFLWVTFGVAIGILAILLASSGCCLRGAACGCGSAALAAVLTGALGTTLLSVVLLAVTFAATSIVGAVAVGLLVLFFALMLTSAACLIRCLSAKN